MLVAGIVGGVAGLALIGALIAFAFSSSDNSGDGNGQLTAGATGGTQGSDPFNVSSVPLPTFPELGSVVRRFPSGVETYFVELSKANPGSQVPGSQMGLRIYRPAGARTPGSAPCVLIAPAGTNLLVGSAMDADDYHDETLPYAEAGFVTIFFGLDGDLDLESATNNQFRDAYQEFRDAGAGIVNARNALEYALARIPEVNPQQIYTAGHSSAGNVSLLTAIHEQRIAGCIAYAPCADTESFLSEALQDPSLGSLLPGVADFVRNSSPLNHAGKLNCPLFVFHAEDDSVTPIHETAEFVEAVRRSNPQVDFQRVPAGDHYQSMISQGVPAGVRHIQQWSQASPQG